MRGALTVAEAEQCLAQHHAPWLLNISQEALADLWQALPTEPKTLSDAGRVLLAGALECLVRGARQRQGTGNTPAPGDAIGQDSTADERQRVAQLYVDWGPTVRCRFQLLAWLSTARGDERLGLLAELLATDPPDDGNEVMQILGPLFQRPDRDVNALFPRLLDGLQHVSVASPILDLTNFLVRAGRLETHPAADRGAALVGLLQSVTRRLRHWEVMPEMDPTGSADGERGRGQRQVFESLALVISLCDTLALVGDRSATEALQDVMQLRHRRLRTEAAAALARLGDDSGPDALVALATEPVARLRVLAYADEIGLSDRIDDRYRTPVARAEAELALWLAQPVQFGVPPRDIELFDNRQLYWPGFDDPVDCYLFRFHYHLADAQYANIAIVGPLTHAFRADLADLSPDDIYAAFAGWHAEHDEIHHQDVTHLQPRQKAEVARLERRLRDGGYQRIEPRLLGHFLGDWVLVAAASREEQQGLAIVDPQDILWWPGTTSRHPLGAEDWYCVYKGRRILRTFNT
jgi:hypothetical protein